MPLQSDLQIDRTKFAPSAVFQKTKDFNQKLMDAMQNGPAWYEVGAEKYRQMRWNGETPMPRPTVLAHGKDMTFPSRDKDRSLTARVFEPRNGNKSKGLFMHIHGGGWVLQSEAYQDTMLAYMADECDLTVISIGYRLAPEHPFPAGNEDCFDAAEYLVDSGEERFGARLMFMGGDSAGAHLSALTAFHLIDTRPEFAFKGLVLNFGAFQLGGWTPQVYHFDQPLILDRAIMARYLEAYLPGKTEEERRAPSISPLYKDMSSLNLPPALFTCGTRDCLYDDTIFMGAKWALSGAESITKFYPGAPHGFVFFPPGACDQTEKALADIKVFLNEHVG
ncbi:hypothetical protein AAFC00_003438 [Neodothiora populina]|uniref:Alpha/beta hydrolase fold-3 domain-containing protein n=1 Tax=Neodothiora populina TaxID=2781224 RepID=A0ABR3PE85_9PEZI